MNRESNTRDLIIEPPALPLCGAAAESFMREVEVTVLDEHHKDLPIWQLDANTAFYTALLAFDSFAVVMRRLSEATKYIGVMQFLKVYHDGFAQAIRWLYPRISESSFCFVANDSQIDAAGQFLNYTVHYSVLEALHIGFGKSLVSVEADRHQRIVRFVPRRDYPGTQSHLYFADLIARQQSRHMQPADPRLGIADFAAQAGNCSFKQGRIDFISILLLLGDELREASRSELRTEVVSLLGADSLGHFNYSQFETFWLNMHAWSSCALRMYLALAESGIPQFECMPTQVLTRDEFLSAMCEVSQLERSVVEAITVFLTYDNRTKRPDPFLQPIFQIDDRVMWSALSVVLSRQPRNALKLLCRDKRTQNFGATLNGSRERRMLRRFGEYLQTRSGYAYKLNVPLSHGAMQSELDLLAYNAKTPSEVLLVQGKTPIAADDQHEIDAVTKDIIEGQAQCRTAEAILKAMPKERRQALFPFVNWDNVQEYYSLVITPDSEPHRKYDPKEVPAISILSLEQRLRPRDRKRPSALWNACRTRPWLATIASGVLAYEHHEVADVTYEIPIELTREEWEQRQRQGNVESVQSSDGS